MKKKIDIEGIELRPEKVCIRQKIIKFTYKWKIDFKNLQIIGGLVHNDNSY